MSTAASYCKRVLQAAAATAGSDIADSRTAGPIPRRPVSCPRHVPEIISHRRCTWSCVAFSRRGVARRGTALRVSPFVRLGFDVSRVLADSPGNARSVVASPIAARDHFHNRAAVMADVGRRPAIRNGKVPARFRFRNSARRSAESRQVDLDLSDIGLIRHTRDYAAAFGRSSREKRRSSERTDKR